MSEHWKQQQNYKQHNKQNEHKYVCRPPSECVERWTYFIHKPTHDRLEEDREREWEEGKKHTATK